MLAQFVSPHTGLTYQKHITGLCEFMQQEVELEVKRAQKMGNGQFINVTPAISTVFLIYRILYSISIGSILNIKSPVFDKTFKLSELISNIKD